MNPKSNKKACLESAVMLIEFLIQLPILSFYQTRHLTNIIHKLFHALLVVVLHIKIFIINRQT